MKGEKLGFCVVGCGMIEAARKAALVFAAYESARTGSPVALPLTGR